MNLAKIALVLLFLSLVAVSAEAQKGTDGKLDQKVRAEYARIEEARKAMNGDMSEEERTKKMAAFQESCRRFVLQYEGKADQLAEGLFDLGRAAIQSFSPEKAVTFFKSFIARNPRSGEKEEALMFLGDAYRSVNRPEEAVALYQKFIKDYPSSKLLAPARLGLATSWFLSLEFDKAVATYRQILSLHPRSEVRADAAFQLLNALVFAGDYEGAREHLARLLEEAPEAPELVQKKEQFELLGRPAPELTGLLDWQGPPGSTLARMKGRVDILCFFMVKSIPCARTLQALSALEKDLQVDGVTVWGLSKTYRAGKGQWTAELESRWLGRYRQNPRHVLQRELAYTPKGGADEERIWSPLEKPITVSLGLTRDISNLKAYHVRRVPTIVVIDKEGRVRLMMEGSQPEGSFQSRMLRRVAKRMAVE